MANNSDIIKIGFDYRSSLAQFEKETNGVFDGISEKAGKQKIVIQLDAKNDKVIEKIKELQKLKLDKFTFEFGDSGIKEQLKTFGQLENKINEIINLSKGIDGKVVGNGIGNSIVDEKSLNNIIDLFTKMESHLSSIKTVFSDVGDGEEFSPLLKMINNVQTAIYGLSSSVKGIGLNMNMNIDVGSNSEMEAKVQSKVSNALQAYQRLFDSIKMSGVGGSIINQKFFDFDINQYDTMMGKLQAYKKFIDNMRNEAKAQYNGKDVLYQSVDKSYWTQASSAMGQVTKAFNEMNAVSDTNPLKDLFCSGDLSEVVSQLDKIVIKLEEISTTVSSFKNVFDNGFNVTASVEEIDKLTNRVKELEDELSKIKLNPVSMDKSTNDIKEVGESVDEVKKSLDDIVFKPNTEGFDEIVTKLNITKDKINEINKIIKNSIWSESQGKYLESYNIRYKNGTSETRGESSHNNGSNVLKASEVAYDAKAVEQANKQKLKSEQDLQKQKDAFHKRNISAIDLEIQKRKEESKMVSSALKFQMEVREKQLSSMESSLESYQGKLFDMSAKSENMNMLPEYKTHIESLNQAVSEYESFIKSLQGKGIIDESDIDKSNELTSNIEKLLKKTKTFSSGDKGFTDIGADKVLEKINNILKQNSKMSKLVKDQITAYYNEIRSGNPTKPLNEILDAVYKIVQAEREAGRAGKSFLEIFKEKVIYGGAAQLAGMFGFYDVINMFREAGNTVIKLNTNITELAKVSEQTSSQIYKDFNSYADIAKDVRGTISDTISATSDWSRNGYGIPDAKKLAEVALLYKNVGDGINIDDANESLISTLKGFQLSAEQAEHIIDVFNEVSNNESISSAGIGEALQRSAASFNAANTSLEKSVSLVTATNTVLQDPEKVGNMWRTVSARLRGAESELQNMGEDTDGLVKSTSKLQALVKGITGFDIMKDKDTYKDIYDIVLGIGEKWKDLSDIDRASLLEALAGKQQSNALAAALSNIDILKKSYEEAMNAEGSARRENEEYAKSLQASIDLAKAKLEELANDFLKSDFLKGLIDSGSKLIDILDFLIDKAGILGTTALIGGGILGGKNAGRCA